MLSSSDFYPVTFENKHILDRYLSAYPQKHSEYSVVTMLSWEHYAQCSFAEYKNHLIIECVTDGEHAFFAPVGPDVLPVLDEVYAFAISKGAALCIYDEELCQQFRTRHPEAAVTEIRGYFEYCWKTETLAELKGKRFVGIRGQIHQFQRNFTYTTEKISRKNLEEVRDMIHQWGAEKELEESSEIPDELLAADISLNHFSELNLEGILIRIDGEAAAVSIWENRDCDEVFIHYEKGLKKYPGIFKIINQESACVLRERYAVINREGDMERSGLRESKMRYHPEFFVKAYAVDASSAVPEK
ncbi:MAG TPA: phosphatidylglycerol lysyltransferase domain-containing protein [Methanocorpusculum sp.]|nr:phosphatidylglycerol lysyltransferase domain-containing protein [Methanocorpusculum sp.]